MKRILVVDDEALLGLLIADALQYAGYEVVGPVASVSQALALLSSETCDGGVIDVKLKNSTSEPIARELMARGLPVLAITGFSNEQLPPFFHRLPVMQKPFDLSELLLRLEALMQAPERADRT